MRLLVTGVAGFVGSNTADLLLKAGHEVVGIDDLNSAYDPALKQWRLAQLAGRPGFRSRNVDVSRREDVEGLFADGRFDAILHLAARAGVRQSLEDPWVYLSTNAVGTLNLVDAARRYDVSRFLMASTSSLYGDAAVRPVTETTPTDAPLSPYAASKKAAESMLASYAHLYQLDIAVTRYFTVYGPGGRPDMSIFRFIRWIGQGVPITLYGDGSQERDFTYVEDIARGNLAAIQRSKGYQVYNLGSDSPVPLRLVIKLIEQNLGMQARIERKPFHKADIHATWANISKARAMLDWEPQVGIEDGLARSCAWYLENRDWVDKLDLGAI